MLLSLVVIVFGILQLAKPDLMEKLIKARNVSQGVKTEITPQTKQYN